MPTESFAEHFMAMPAQPAKRWSADEARRLNEGNSTWWPRYGVIDGERLVSPAPRIAHQIAVGELAFLLKRFLAGQKTAGVLTAPADITLETDTATRAPRSFPTRSSGPSIRSTVDSLWPSQRSSPPCATSDHGESITSNSARANDCRL